MGGIECDEKYILVDRGRIYHAGKHSIGLLSIDLFTNSSFKF